MLQNVYETAEQRPVPNSYCNTIRCPTVDLGLGDNGINELQGSHHDLQLVFSECQITICAEAFALLQIILWTARPPSVRPLLAGPLDRGNSFHTNTKFTSRPPTR